MKHKILLSYVKDLSLETASVESLVIARERISKYILDIDINSKAIKRQMIEVCTKLVYSDPEKNQKRTLFEMEYATVLSIEEEKPDPDKLKKFILCDLQIQIYPKIQETFISIMKLSGFKDIEISGSVDFEKLYNQKKT